MFKRILVPLDSSRFSSQAIRYATKVAQRFDAEVILVQAIHPATLMPVMTEDLTTVESPATAKMAIEAAFSEDNRHITRAKRYLSRKIGGIRSHGIKGSYHVIIGDPPESIMEFAWKEHIDLVVMTTHGKGGLKRAIMGSVADAVIRKSGKPVLVVRPKSFSKK